MKKLLQSWGILFLLCFMSALQVNAGPGLVFNYCNFGPDSIRYTELYFRLPGQTLHYTPAEEGGYRFMALLQYRILSQKKVIFTDKVWIKGPLVTDTLQEVKDLITQVRMQLHSGHYQIEMMVADRQDTADLSFLPAEIVVENEPMRMSAIELLDTVFASTNTTSVFYRTGYELMPLVVHIVQDRLQFYTEFYGFAAAENLKAEYYLEGGVNKFPRLIKSRKLTSSNYVRLLDGIDISTMEPGDYKLRINAYDGDNHLLCSDSVSFTRLLMIPRQDGQPNVTAQQMFNALPTRYYIALAPYLQPVASETEIGILNTAIDTEDTVGIKNWYFSFWQTKDKNNPYAAWQRYLGLVQKSEALFGSVNRKGYKTDRGKIFLRFGEPNGMTASHNEQEAYPYEIWQYYVAGKQRNVKFVFYDPTSTAQDFVLLYSDYRGLANNPKWKKIIYSRTDTSRPEDNKVPQHYGNDLDERLRE